MLLYQTLNSSARGGHYSSLGKVHTCEGGTKSFLPLMEGGGVQIPPCFEGGGGGVTKSFPLDGSGRGQYQNFLLFFGLNKLYKYMFFFFF